MSNVSDRGSEKPFEGGCIFEAMAYEASCMEDFLEERLSRKEGLIEALRTERWEADRDEFDSAQRERVKKGGAFPISYEVAEEVAVLLGKKADKSDCPSLNRWSPLDVAKAVARHPRALNDLADHTMDLVLEVESITESEDDPEHARRVLVVM